MGFFDFLKTKVADPVCGMKFVKNENTLTSKYAEKDYYFCSNNCKTQFDQSPGKYLTPQTPPAPPAPAQTPPQTPAA